MWLVHTARANLRAQWALALLHTTKLVVKILPALLHLVLHTGRLGLHRTLSATTLLHPSALPGPNIPQAHLITRMLAARRQEFRAFMALIARVYLITSHSTLMLMAVAALDSVARQVTTWEVVFRGHRLTPADSDPRRPSTLSMQTWVLPICETGSTACADRRFCCRPLYSTKKKSFLFIPFRSILHIISPGIYFCTFLLCLFGYMIDIEILFGLPTR